ncbi:hypothetical protein F01_420852 [Burkholderia cenocepacia]|nr:hypothetical protein F01_420852 [Burkholderia cenocepacia]
MSWLDPRLPGAGRAAALPQASSVQGAHEPCAAGSRRAAAPPWRAVDAPFPCARTARSSASVTSARYTPYDRFILPIRRIDGNRLHRPHSAADRRAVRRRHAPPAVATAAAADADRVRRDARVAEAEPARHVRSRDLHAAVHSAAAVRGRLADSETRAIPAAPRDPDARVRARVHDGTRSGLLRPLADSRVAAADRVRARGRAVADRCGRAVGHRRQGSHPAATDAHPRRRGADERRVGPRRAEVRDRGRADRRVLAARRVGHVRDRRGRRARDGRDRVVAVQRAVDTLPERRTGRRPGARHRDDAAGAVRGLPVRRAPRPVGRARGRVGRDDDELHELLAQKHRRVARARRKHVGDDRVRVQRHGVHHARAAVAAHHRPRARRRAPYERRAGRPHDLQRVRDDARAVCDPLPVGVAAALVREPPRRAPGPRRHDGRRAHDRGDDGRRRARRGHARRRAVDSGRAVRRRAAARPRHRDLHRVGRDPRLADRRGDRPAAAAARRALVAQPARRRGAHRALGRRAGRDPRDRFVARRDFGRSRRIGRGALRGHLRTRDGPVSPPARRAGRGRPHAARGSEAGRNDGAADADRGRARGALGAVPAAQRQQDFRRDADEADSRDRPVGNRAVDAQERHPLTGLQRPARGNRHA